MGGNIVDKAYIVTLPDDLLANWRPFSVCGFSDFPALFILDPTSIVHGISFTIAMPHTVHLGSYLCQSDAEHPPNVILIMIVEDYSDSVATFGNWGN